nr:hypothetical protein [Tanacetum cinerariifolium]
AIKNEDEVYNSLLAAKDAKRGEESKLLAFNDVIMEASDDIETLETDVEYWVVMIMVFRLCLVRKMYRWYYGL